MDTDLSPLPHYIILPIPHLWHVVAVNETGLMLQLYISMSFGDLSGILFVILQSMILLVSNIVNTS